MVNIKNSEKFKEFLQKNGIKNLKSYKRFEEALTHRSYSRKHNERLEFLGDAVLELVITDFLYHDYPERQEGELTSFRAALVKTESLSAESLRLGINAFILMSQSEEATGGRERQYILADIFEAFIGALYEEKGIEECKEFIRKNLYYKVVEIVDSRLDIDAKSKLQEYAQEVFKATPYYKVIKEEGPDHDKSFTVIAVIDNKEYESGSGKSKQIAEQEAASKTLSRITTPIEKLNTNYCKI